MSKSTRRLLVSALFVLGFLALLNPGYSSATVEGPNGVVRTERYTFGPNSLFVYTRVVADDSTVQIEHR
ncbi:MAG TPA: hypothetical protein VD866_31980 [Urbifossiella sp.]|nr:hypothetical protein [Urbifossiella sp.]